MVYLNGDKRVQNIASKRKERKQQKLQRQLSSHVKSISTFLQILTIAVVAVSRRELHSRDLLQVVCHAQSSERRREVDLMGRSLRTVRVISHLVSSSDVLHHS